MSSIKADVIEIPKKKLEKVASDPEGSAKLFRLTYISGNEPGITRKKNGNGFSYFVNDEPVKDEATLARIKKLVIPPAWQQVWICKRDDGHLQATGIDARGRKQYRYHALWNKMRHETKYFRLYEFGKQLPAIRAQLEKDIALPGMPPQKVLAAMVMIMERTSIRVGNAFYEKLYGSFGLTTLKGRHVKLKGSDILFTFKGKKGVKQTLSLHSRRLANIVKKCQDIPGKELFEFYDAEGNIHTVDSGMLNQYIQQLCGEEFSSKDFRTWSGTLCALAACRQRGEVETATEMKHKLVEVLDDVAAQLGNTRNVCKKYYVHPVILELFETHKLGKFSDADGNSNKDGYSPDEQVLMKILEWNAKSSKAIEVDAA